MSRKPLSDQLRKAINDCGVSRYLIEQELGVLRSTLNKFLDGRRGLNLVSLNALAEALGLEAMVGVQNLRRPRPQGGAARMAVPSPPDWRQLAAEMKRGRS